MRSKIVKRVLYSFLLLIVLFCLLMLTPRTYSVLFPEKLPLGYHYLWTSYLAIAVGLEEVIEKDTTIPDDIEAIENIGYKNVDGQSLQLDILRPRSVHGRAPLVVFLHGGGWVKGKRGDMLKLLVDFSKRGYVTATVSYRLGAHYPACVEDISDAVDWFYDHGDEYGYDPDRIALVGASAGAHLAMMAGYGWKDKVTPDTVGSSRRIKAVVNIFGPVDFTTDFARNHPTAISFIGKSYGEAAGLYREASPIRYVGKTSPPTLIIQGTSDELVPNDQADLLRAKLDSLRVPCADYRFPLWPHAMILVQRVYNYCPPIMDDFFKKYL